MTSRNYVCDHIVMVHLLADINEADGGPGGVGAESCAICIGQRK